MISLIDNLTTCCIMAAIIGLGEAHGLVFNWADTWVGYAVASLVLMAVVEALRDRGRHQQG